MASTMCLSGGVLLKAGANVSTNFTLANGVNLDPLINQAESYINVVTGVNFTDIYSTLNDDVKKILEDACSSKAALIAIAYDPFSYNSLEEAQFLADMNYTILNDTVRLLKDRDVVKIVKTP